MSSDHPDALRVDALMRDDPGVSIAAQGLGKCYEIFDRPSDRLKQVLLRRSCGHHFWALRDVSFVVRKGEALGVVGHNGAGKSTLLQILAGALKPTTGEARLRGRVASLLELGSGFLPDFTGRENVFVNGTALGLSTGEIGRRLPEIQAFAEIGDFFDQPVKTYSSGMFVRLAFAVQACLDPDILIVDEALAVGDIFFQQKCHAHMASLLERGTSILLVTHDVQAVRKYCSEVILLDGGYAAHQGDVEVGLRLYLNRMSSAARQSLDSPPQKIAEDEGEQEFQHTTLSHWPSAEAFFDLAQTTSTENEPGAVQVEAFGLCDEAGRPCRSFEQNQTAYFYAEVKVLRDMRQLVAGIAIWTADNMPIYCQSTLQGQANIPKRMKNGESLRLQWAIALPLARGQYAVEFDLSEYPEWTREKLKTIAPESFWPLGLPLLSMTRVGSFAIVQPRHGLPNPFMGMVDLETKINVQQLVQKASPKA